MITRRQLRRQVESSPQVGAKSKPKKTKAQVLQQIHARRQQQKGNKVAAKKIKEEEKPKTAPKSVPKSIPKQQEDKNKKANQQIGKVEVKNTKAQQRGQNKKDQKNQKQDAKDVKKKKNTSKAQSQRERSKSPERKKPQAPQVKVQEQKQNVKKIIMKGKIPIDDHFPNNKDQFHVLETQGKIYSATLNQTNVSNNNNKFYILQILQSDSNPNNNFFYCRWGRVGVVGQSTCMGPCPTMAAIQNFNSKYREKHGKGGYRQVELNYGDDQDNKEEQKKQEQIKDKNQNKPQNESKLQKPVKDLISLIFDINMMNRQMKEIGYNVDKMPLGKLSRDNIKKGFGILNDLLEAIKKNKTKQIQDLTNDFYSFIPHDFGFQKMHMFILNTQQKVKNKITMLQALSQIKVATNLLSQNKISQNVIDSNYSKLKRDITHINPSTSEYQTINNYLQTTHGKHHTNYALELVDLFKINDERENIRYTKDIPNKMLLWHGSRLTNFVGILSQGLRIAPPQAPVSGYMFGKGVYFADMSSKSANYCSTSIDNPTGILLLCEVALGQMNQKEHADFYASNLPPGKNSTKGLGKIAPNPKYQTSLQEGVTIPMGPSIESQQNFRLRYNEFIVYDVAQIKIKYLLRTKFNYANRGRLAF